MAVLDGGMLLANGAGETALSNAIAGDFPVSSGRILNALPRHTGYIIIKHGLDDAGATHSPRGRTWLKNPAGPS